MDTTTTVATLNPIPERDRSRPRSRSRTVGAVMAGVLIGATGFAAVRVSGSSSQPSLVVPLDPERILDTRNGVGQPAAGAVGADRTITLQVAGVGSIPTTATGVILNITATAATEASWVAAWPTGATRPNTSILNFTTGEDVANMITATLGAGGAIDLYNNTGTVHLVADVAGYLVPGGSSGGPTAHTLEVVAYGAVGPANPFGHGCLTLATQPTEPEVSLGIPLPAGAVITAVRVRYRDLSASGAISFDLQRITGFAGGASASTGVVSGVFTSSGPGTTNGNVADLFFNALTAVSDSTIYYLRAFGPVNTGGLQFCGASFDYTLA